MDWCKRFNRFDFDDEATADKKIDLSGAYDHISVSDFNTLLLLEQDTSMHELDDQGTFINFFGQTWPKFSMNFDRSTDYLARQSIQLRWRLYRSSLPRNLIFGLHLNALPN